LSPEARFGFKKLIFKFHDRKGLMFEGLFQPMHLLVIAGLVLLIFGPKKLPELGKGIGEGLRGFKAAMNPTETPHEEPKEKV
jgi:sec-independent protein translocase protein TatA